MRKELFHILQDLKIDINSIDIEKIDNYIKKIKGQMKEEEIMHANLNKQAFLLDLKFISLSLLTFGIYYSKNKYEYDLRISVLNGALNKIEEEYNDSLIALVIYEIEKNIRTNEKESFIKNRDQIDRFLSLFDKLSKDEQEKVLSYKVGN